MYFFTVPHKGSKGLCLVRNPLDMIVSLFQMTVTLTHNKTCSNDWVNECPDEWAYAITMFTKIWSEFYEYWLNLAKTKTTPVLFIRYEDLCSAQVDTMKEVIAYMLGAESISGTYIEKRLETILSSGTAGQLYVPRSGKINSNLKYFNKE